MKKWHVQTIVIASDMDDKRKQSDANTDNINNSNINNTANKGSLNDSRKERRNSNFSNKTGNSKEKDREDDNDILRRLSIRRGSYGSTTPLTALNDGNIITQTKHTLLG